MARSVADAAALLSVLAAYDPADPVTALSQGPQNPNKLPLDYTRFLDPNGLRGARIGVFRRYMDRTTADPEVNAITEQAIRDLRAQGATIVDPFDLPDYDKLTKHLWCGDFEADLNAYFAKHGQNAPYTKLADIVASGLYLPYIQEEIKGAVKASRAKTDPAKPGSTDPDSDDHPCADVYHDPPKIAFRNALLAAMERDHLDAVIYPTWSNPPRKVGDMKSPAGDNSQVLSPQTGYPAMTVPMGFTHGTLPAGLTFLGPLFSEPILIRLAYAYEQATHHRRSPAAFRPLP
jgi:Asp-tRNA(Asn)/Glu-tRNA(Gln) amidotransferase A subunit family amidase